jgi:hypothetical protein
VREKLSSERFIFIAAKLYSKLCDYQYFASLQNKTGIRLAIAGKVLMAQQLHGKIF